MNESTEYLQRIIRFTIYGGWLCLTLSSLCLYVSIREYGIDYDGSTAFYALWLTAARVFGLGAFATGAVAIVNRRWTHGTLLFVGSVGLPAISLYIHGSL